MKDKSMSRCTNNIMIFAGTVDGRDLANQLVDAGLEVYVSVATEYGASLYEACANLHVSAKRRSLEEMVSYIEEVAPKVIVDVTHPYAVHVTKNIKEACEQTQVPYLRLLRKEGEGINDKDSQLIYVESVEDAASYLEDTKGNIFVTTGSKELHKFTKLTDFQERVYARVLSLPSVVEDCSKLGIQGKHLMCMQGPFSYEMNVAMLNSVNASYLVTKDSGSQGGIEEKYQAAFDMGVKVIVIGRPKEEDGLSYEACIKKLTEYYTLNWKRKITLLGIGMGNVNTMTVEGKDACKRAQLIIGAKRMVECAVSLYDGNQEISYSYKADEICTYILEHPEYEQIVVALSGDVGFYSGAKKLLDEFRRYGIDIQNEVSVLPGISSVSYFSAKIKKSYEDVALISIHGREQSVIEHLKKCGKVFAIVGTTDGIKSLCGQLVAFDLGDTKVWIGENLSYEKESILNGTAESFVEYDSDVLSVIYLENHRIGPYVITPGVSDDAFLRGKVPMTKEEIRSISLCKLQLTEDAVVYDVGAGTGSISIEAARLVTKGKVYAIEKNEEAIGLLKENKKKFKASNLEIVKGMAPDALVSLPAPTHAFIGGSSGNLREIITLLCEKNKKVHIVMNAITLETINEATACVQVLEEDGRTVDIVSVSVAKSKSVGHYHMMIGHNPVSIFTVL